MRSVFRTPNDGHYFFGYYDKSPFDIDSSKLLACKSSFIDRTPNMKDVLEIGYFNWRHSNQFIKLTTTRAWNWQQGCMLQWLGDSYNSSIIFNDRVENKFVTVVFNIETQERKIIPMAYYTASSKGEFALTIDFERHYWYRGGYNYQGIENYRKKINFDKKDGIWHIDTITGKTVKIIDMKVLMSIKHLSNMKGAIHYIEHLMLSPNNKRFAFLHRWSLADGGIYSRLYTSNIDGSEIFLLNDSGRMSHFCWRNDECLLGWGGISTPINQMRKYRNIIKYFVKPLLPIYYFLSKNDSLIKNIVSGDNYLMFQDKTQHVDKVSVEILREDGHPSFLHDKDVFVSDTYPDVNGISELFLFNLKRKKKILLDKLGSIKELNNSACRCDLHPKVSLDGKYISIDTTNEGNRSMYVYKT